EFIAVFGPGPIGLFAVALAKLAGASHIFLFGTAGDEARLAFGKEIGADIVARVDERSASDVISQLLGTDGVDVVIDAAGPGVVMENAMTIIRPLGRIVKVGWGKPYPQLFDPLMVKGATITGHFGYDYVSWRNIIHLVQAGRLHYGSFISKTYSLDQWEEAFVAVEEKKVIKVVFNQF
ncbi:MAG: zinc-binding dehydrogenase, partial [Atribacterota bacterium]